MHFTFSDDLITIMKQFDNYELTTLDFSLKYYLVKNVRKIFHIGKSDQLKVSGFPTDIQEGRHIIIFIINLLNSMTA